MSKALLIAFLSHAALWGGSGADLYTTRKAIQAGSVEANPLLGQTLKSQATIILLNNLAKNLRRFLIKNMHISWQMRL